MERIFIYQILNAFNLLLIQPLLFWPNNGNLKPWEY